MDDIIEPTEVIEETSFTTELAKTAALSTATTAGTLVGFVLVGAVANKIQKIRAARAAAKEETPTQED